MLTVLHFLFFSSVTISAENTKTSSITSDTEFVTDAENIDLASVEEINSFVINLNDPVDVLYKKVRRAKRLRNAGIIMTPWSSYLIVVGIPLLAVGSHRYRAYKKAGINYRELRATYKESVRNGKNPGIHY